MTARGINATSGRKLRSCEGWMKTHHATTPRNNTIAVADMRRRRENQMAQIVNAAKAAASAKRIPADGRFEYEMARVPHGRSAARHRDTMVATSQPRGLKRKLRRKLIGSSRRFIPPTAYRR